MQATGPAGVKVAEAPNKTAKNGWKQLGIPPAGSGCTPRGSHPHLRL